MAEEKLEMQAKAALLVDPRVIELFEKGDVGAALGLVSAHLNQNTCNTAALYYGALCFIRMGQHAMGSILLERLIEAHEKGAAIWPPGITDAEKNNILANSWNNIGFCYKNNNNFIPAKFAFLESLKFEEVQKSRVYSNIATLYITNGTPEECVEWCQKSLALDPDDETTKWNLAQAQLEMGHFSEGWKGYELDLRKKSARNYTPGGRTPRWDGKSHQNVVVYGEQGLGDEIMFASLLPEAMRSMKRCILHPAPRVAKLLQRSFPQAKVYGGHEADCPDWIEDEQIEACIPLGSLGGLYRPGPKSFRNQPQSFLIPDPKLREKYKNRLAALGPGPYIGLAWVGGVKETRVDLRSVYLEWLRPLFSNPRARFVSLQYNNPAGKSPRLEAEECGIPHWADAGEAWDMDETAALIAECDLVISVNQTAVHLAGGLGKECWTLTPNRPSWRYCTPTDRMRWYPSVELIRQNLEEPWHGAIERAARKLDGWLDQRGIPRTEQAAA